MGPRERCPGTMVLQLCLERLGLLLWSSRFRFFLEVFGFVSRSRIVCLGERYRNGLAVYWDNTLYV